MVFPATPLALTVEIQLGGVWTDITSDVQQRDGISLTRGRSAGSTTFQADRGSLSLNNRLGKYSPRNPLGTYYGLIGLNTPIRITVGAGTYARRFTGEVSAWPAQWDVSGKDAYVLIEFSGVLRRARQGTAVSVGAYEEAIRALMAGANSDAYWPLDDPVGTSWTKATGGGGGVGASASFIGDLGEHLPHGLALVTVPGTFYTFPTGGHPGSTTVAADFVFRNPDGNQGTLNVWIEDRISGIDDYWKLRLRIDGTNNDAEVTLDDSSSGGGVASLGNSVVLPELTDGATHHGRLLLANSGADIAWSVWIDGVSILSGTKVGVLLDMDPMVHLGYTPIAAVDTQLAIGHLVLWINTPPSILGNSLVIVMNGYAGETAGARFLRLSTAVGYANSLDGGAAADTITMGAQHDDAYTGQLAEIETADRGLIFESRTGGVSYKTRAALYNQAATVTISYSAHELAHPFEPIEDDQDIHNDIFAQRRDGNSAQATKETGPLSVLDFPNGVGRYKDEIQVNTESDQQLDGLAHFILSQGTVDEARFPTVAVDLANPNVVANATLSAAILQADIGDKLVITNASAAGFYDDIVLLILGHTETMNLKEHRFTYNCVSATPFQPAVYGAAVGDGASRYDTAGSKLNALVTSTATSLSVAVTEPIHGNTLWTTVAGEFPFDIYIAGERMTVTTISGATSPQTFTVTRSVNGVVKGHAAATAVRLWKTPRYGL